MLSFHKPDTAKVDIFRAKQPGTDYSYTAIGDSQRSPPPGYSVDHNRVYLGTGHATFLVGCEALRCWKMFNVGWISVQPSHPPIVQGQGVALIVHVFGCWSLNACRIVYTQEEEGPIETFGFAYGTLSDHMAQGEERFRIEWHHADDSVWYDLFAFSKPRHFLFRLGYPISRWVQRRFGRNSLTAMTRAVRAVANGENTPDVGHIQVVRRRTDPGELARWIVLVGGIVGLLGLWWGVR